MSCSDTVLGSGILSMFSPTPCHTCPETEEEPGPTPGAGYDGFLLMAQSGRILMTESGHLLAIE